MANTYVLISSQLLASNSASVTFSAIPQTYSDLEVRCYVKTSATGTIGAMSKFTLNPTAGALSLNGVRINNNMAGWSSDVTANAAFGNIPGLATSDATSASQFGFQSMYIANYASGSVLKSLIAKGTFGVNGASSSNPVWGHFLYSTLAATAISEIKIEDTTGGNFVTGCRFDLYGI